MNPDQAYRDNFKLIDWSVPIETVKPERPKGPWGDVACPTFISDHMEPTQSMADGKVYDSKRAMSAATRRAGCIEIGNEKIPPRQRQTVTKREVKDSLERAQARWNRGERA